MRLSTKQITRAIWITFFFFLYSFRFCLTPDVRIYVTNSLKYFRQPKKEIWKNQSKCYLDFVVILRGQAINCHKNVIITKLLIIHVKLLIYCDNYSWENFRILILLFLSATRPMPSLPFENWFLFFLCLFVSLYFPENTRNLDICIWMRMSITAIEQWVSTLNWTKSISDESKKSETNQIETNSSAIENAQQKDRKKRPDSCILSERNRTGFFFPLFRISFHSVLTIDEKTKSIEAKRQNEFSEM